jgi:drug/metabolite transporter (DMT)-like permease
MWILWALVAMVGSTIWYIGPKIFPTHNPFTPLVIAGIGGILIGLIFSKIFYKTWFDVAAVPLGIFYAFTWMATVGMILAINAGGKVGPVATIIELSVILATLAALFFFREHLHWIQMLGILFAVAGIILVVFFQK